MSVILLGLAARDAAALRVLLERRHAGARIQAVTGAEASPAAADLYIVDLLALDMPHHTPAAAARLREWIGAQPAVLLVPAVDESWPAALAGAEPPWPATVCLHRPYRAEAMQQAIDAALRRRALPATPATANTLTPAVEWSASADRATLARRLAVAGESRWLRQLGSLLAAGQPFEMHFTVQHMLVVDPAAGYAARNTPLEVVQRVSRSDALASVVTTRVVDAAHAWARVGQLGLTVEPIEDLIAALLTPSPARPEFDDAVAVGRSVS